MMKINKLKLLSMAVAIGAGITNSAQSAGDSQLKYLQEAEDRARAGYMSACNAGSNRDVDNASARYDAAVEARQQYEASKAPAQTQTQNQQGTK